MAYAIQKKNDLLLSSNGESGPSGTVNILGVGRKFITTFIFAKAGTPYLLFYKAGIQSGYPYPLFREAGMEIILSLVFTC